VSGNAANHCAQNALFASRPELAAPDRTAALDRLKALGFDLSRLSFPRH